MELDKLEKKKPLRNKKGQLLPGQPSINPNGRPKGQSLKEYWRTRFYNMTDEEKLAFSEKMGLETVWRMAEGNPHSTEDSNIVVTTPIPIDDVLKDSSVQENKEPQEED